MWSLALLLGVFCAVALWFKYVRANSSLHALPPAVPGKLPIVGHGYKLFKYFTNLMELVSTLSEDCAKQGGVTYFNFGKEFYYLIVDPQDALTASNVCTQKHYVFEFGECWLGDSILKSSALYIVRCLVQSEVYYQVNYINLSDVTSSIIMVEHHLGNPPNMCISKKGSVKLVFFEGDIWKRHRRYLMPAFTLPVIHGFLDVFNSQSRNLASSMERHVGNGSFDHFPYLKHNALETLCVGTFGINAIEDVEFTERYLKSVDKMINIAIMKAVKFWLQNDFIYRLVGLKKREEEVVGILHAMADTVLQQKKAAMRDENPNKDIEFETTGHKYKPFLDHLLALSNNGAMTDKEIRDEMNGIIVAGYETTSTEMTTILALLGGYPEVQEKVYEELIEVLGVDGDVDKDNLNKLVYTHAVLMECLRMFPGVPVILRSVLQDTKLKNYTMRAGSHCIIFPLATHLDPTWGAESDKFKPERWLNGDFRNNKEFAAFGLGKRSCIGRTYAMISMKVTLAHFIRRYRVTADLSKLKMKYEFIMKPVSGHEISIERRNKPNSSSA